MVSTITAPKALQDETEAFIADKLSKYVPMFAQNTDRGAWDLIGNLEKIIEFKLYERLGFSSMNAYAEKHLQHSADWCGELIRIYREESTPDATIEEVVSKADRNAEIHRLREVGMTQQAIADEVGCSQMQVSRVLNPNSLKPNTRQLYIPQSAEDAATKIREKFGDEFADQLKQCLHSARNTV